MVWHVTKRDESVVDGLLRAAPYLPSVLRTLAARRAAARGLGVPALRAAPEDPVVLARLGMNLKAGRVKGEGRGIDVARAAAAGAMGDLESARRVAEDLHRLSSRDRRWLAASVAPFSPQLALVLLPVDDNADRAACALAAGDLEEASDYLGKLGSGPGAALLSGALAAWCGDWRNARMALNEGFISTEMSPPLDGNSDRPTTLSEFGGTISLAKVSGPLVSVVVPVHNGEETLRISVASLLAQTWFNLEIVIVDDRSTDGTRAIAEDLARLDARVRVMPNEREAGAYGARNSGIVSARGAFIALHDADDWAHPQRIERQMTVIGDNRAATICRYFRLDTKGRPLCPRVFPFVRLSPIAITTRAEVWARVGLYDEAEIGADSEWLSRLDDRLGRRASPRTRNLGMVALWDDRSLSGAPSTGMKGEGLRRRVRYVEQWRSRHAKQP